MRYILILAFTACCAALYVVTDMATTYATEGHGLHPAAAMLLGVVLTVLGTKALVLGGREA